MKLLSPIAKNVSADSRIPLRFPEAPLREATEMFRLRLRCAEGSYFQKGKDSSVPIRDKPLPRELPESDNFGAHFHYTQQTSTTYWLSTGPKSGVEQQIISSIKTFRNKN
jgi:hypothetical protein